MKQGRTPLGELAREIQGRFESKHIDFFYNRPTLRFKYRNRKWSRRFHFPRLGFARAPQAIRHEDP